MAQEKMTERIITVVLTLVVAGVLGVVGTALGGGALIGALGGVQETEPTFDQQVGTLSDRVQALQAKIEGATSVPTGAVMAFDLATRCPDGWGAFKDAGGRTVIGAGAGMIPGTEERDESIQTKKYRQHGGEEEVTLTEPQMPKHKHTIQFKGSDTAINAPAGTQRGATRTTGPTETRFAGKSQPHNNMPPYIALYFCKKD